MNLQSLKILVALGLMTVSAMCWAELTARVDRNIIDTNETLQFVLRYDGQAIASEPDFSPLQNDFDILSNNRQQQYSWVNGQSQSYTDWNMVLMPKRTGVILIPSISYKNEVSNALEITVRAVNKLTAGAGKQPVYAETLVDKQAVYIQEQIVLTQRLYTSVQLQDLSLSDLEVTDALVQRIGESQFQKVINGRNYLVIEVKYALFPQVSGKLDIPAMRFGAFESSRRQFGAFSSRGKQLFRTTEPKTIDVMARPAHIPPGQWMPSSNVELQEQWSSDLDNLKLGEPVTRTITLSAEGLTGAQIQPLPVTESSDYKLYPDQPKIEEQTNASGIVGVRTETLALVPNRMGEIRLPAIEVRWWDTQNQRMQTAMKPAVTLQVGAAAATAPRPQLQPDPQSTPLALTPLATMTLEPQPAEPSALIKWSLALNALLLTALIAVLMLRKRPPSAGGPKQPANTSLQLNLKQKLRLAETQAADNNLIGMRDSIVDWGKTLFSSNPPSGLKQLAQQLGDQDLMLAFEQLDRQLYKGEQPAAAVDFKQLIKQLRAASAKIETATKNKPRGQGLDPLYPGGKLSS